MPKVTLDGAQIKDAASFHAACKAAFGFPDFYGNTMDAWVDCLSYLRDDDAMSAINLDADEVLEIVVKNAEAWRAADPDLLEEVTFLVDAVNERYEDYGEKPALALKLLPV